jgi:hypothetical protein
MLYIMEIRTNNHDTLYYMTEEVHAIYFKLYCVNIKQFLFSTVYCITAPVDGVIASRPS